MRGSRYVARVRGLGEPLWVGAAVVVFIAVTIWWLTVDTRVPDFDSGQHLIDIFTVRAEILSGNLTAPFSDWNNYPPLGHIVGAIGTLIGGFNPASVVMANNLFFLPLLAFGCYGAGTIAGGRRAGLLAALFALGTPIVVSEMREIYLDVGEAAMVAVSVWAILATRRFERIWVSALAGLVCSIGMLSKQTFAVFIVGLIAAVIVRGGWRHWRGIAMFILGGAGLTLPWYVYHYTQLRGLTSGATAGGNAGAGANVANGITPPRWSQQNFGWYVWNMLNHQLLVPLALFLAVGVVLALWRFARHRDPDDVLPELIAGGFFGYLAMTYVTLKDPRYTIPALVYMAVLGTSWLPRASARLRPWLTGAFGVVVLANFVAVSFGFGPTLTITFPGAPNPSTAGARVLTFYSPTGWIRGGPVHEGNILGLFQRRRRPGVTELVVDGGSAITPDFNNAGLSALALSAGLSVPPLENLPAMGPTAAYVRRLPVGAAYPPPCQWLDDGTGVYVSLGNPLMFTFGETTFVCPGRRHPFYHATAPPGQPLMPAPERTHLLAVMRAMRKQGVTTVEFDAATLNLTPFLDRDALENLAAQAGLAVPGVYDPATLGPHEAFMQRQPWNLQKEGPKPCGLTSDGDGLYITLGDPLHAAQSYRYYCPLRSPRFAKW